MTDFKIPNCLPLILRISSICNEDNLEELIITFSQYLFQMISTSRIFTAKIKIIVGQEAINIALQNQELHRFALADRTLLS